MSVTTKVVEMSPHAFESLSAYDLLCAHVEGWERCMRRKDDSIHDLQARV